MIRLLQRLALALAPLLFTACMHLPAPNLPDDWQRSKASVAALENRQSAHLQVLVMSGTAGCNHTALRVVADTDHIAFWDPGGAFAEERVDETRQRDLLIPAPSLQEYLEYRWEGAIDATIEVFEWDLTARRASDLYALLMQGSQQPQKAPGFDTRTSEFFCSIATSNFLHDHASDIVSVPPALFFPHKLSKALYTQHPDRVWFFKDRKPPVLYTQQPVYTAIEKPVNNKHIRKH